MATILATSNLESDSSLELIKSKLIGFLQNVIGKNFESSYFEMDVVDNGGSVSAIPCNLISYLWLSGINANIADIKNDMYEDDLAIFTFDETTKTPGITMKKDVDWFEPIKYK